MNISSTRAYYGLRSVATPTSALIANDVNIGIGSTNNSLTAVDTIFACQGLIVGSSTLAITSNDNDSTGTTAWTAGVAQVETATCTGTITGTGNATITVTASGLTGSPLAVSVAVTNGDTAATWAALVRTALAANAAVSALFTVSGATDAVILTRKPLGTYTVGTTATSTYPANDATLNVASADGTCTGITAAATSANTTAGVLTAGCYLVDGDGNDFEGVALTAIATARQGSYLIRNESVSLNAVAVSSATTLVSFPLPVDSGIQLWANNCDGTPEDFSIVVSGTALVSFVSAGATV